MKPGPIGRGPATGFGPIGPGPIGVGPKIALGFDRAALEGRRAAPA
jgi:hypothetical protein